MMKSGQIQHLHTLMLKYLMLCSGVLVQLFIYPVGWHWEGGKSLVEPPHPVLTGQTDCNSNRIHASELGYALPVRKAPLFCHAVFLDG